MGGAELRTDFKTFEKQRFERKTACKYKQNIK